MMKVTSINGVKLSKTRDFCELNVKSGDVLTGYYDECEGVSEWEVVETSSVLPNGFNIVTPAQKPAFATVLQVKQCT